MNVVFKVILLFAWIALYLFISVFNHEMGHIISCKATNGDVVYVNAFFTDLYPNINFPVQAKSSGENIYFGLVRCANSYNLNIMRISGVLMSTFLCLIILPLIYKYKKFKLLFLFYNPEFILYSMKDRYEFLVGMKGLFDERIVEETMTVAFVIFLVYNILFVYVIKKKHLITPLTNLEEIDKDRKIEEIDENDEIELDEIVVDTVD